MDSYAKFVIFPLQTLAGSLRQFLCIYGTTSNLFKNNCKSVHVNVHVQWSTIDTTVRKYYQKYLPLLSMQNWSIKKKLGIIGTLDNPCHVIVKKGDGIMFKMALLENFILDYEELLFFMTSFEIYQWFKLKKQNRTEWSRNDF